MLRVLKVTLFTLLAAAVLSTTFGAGYALAVANTFQSPQVRLERSSPFAATTRTSPREFALLDEVWTILNEDFVEPKALDPSKLGRGAVDGLITALGDSHTTYIDAETFQAEQTGIRGSYEGIGAHVAMADGALTIVAPIAGSPAEAVGIRAGDKILAVEGNSIQGMSLTDAVNIIKGPRGTKVTLEILHEGATRSQTVVVTRGEIKPQSVILRFLPEGYAHLRIVQFTQRTSAEVKDALKEVKDKKAAGIILDLRNNPGGLLDTTVEVANQFLKGGDAGYQVDRNGRKETLRLTNDGEALDIPVVVLVNRGSASGSELLAGALQDRGRAVLIGTRTFGKGSVNHLRQLSDGSALYVTIGRWLTPNGRQIEGNGLTPDIPLEMTEEDVKNQKDPQLERAIEVMRTRAS